MTVSTTYAVSVLAKDSSDNASAQSTAISVTTTDGSSNGVTDLFFSEYLEGSSYNKALELMNASSDIISLEGYSLKAAFNGNTSWGNEVALNSGTVQNVNPNDVFVVMHDGVDLDDLVDNADLTVNGLSLNFNGNDAVGLFKDGELIDIIGILGNTNDYAKDITLRRKETIVFGNTTFDVDEWEEFSKNTTNGIGSHTATLSINDFEFGTFKLYPNPSANVLQFSIESEADVTVYSILGETVRTKRISQEDNTLNIETLATGVYLVNIRTATQTITRKIIKK